MNIEGVHVWNLTIEFSTVSLFSYFLRNFNEICLKAGGSSEVEVLGVKTNIDEKFISIFRVF